MDLRCASVGWSERPLSDATTIFVWDGGGSLVEIVSVRERKFKVIASLTAESQDHPRLSSYLLLLALGQLHTETCYWLKAYAKACFCFASSAEKFQGIRRDPS